MAKSKSKPMGIDNNVTRPMGMDDNSTRPMGMTDNSTHPINMTEINRVPLRNNVIAEGKKDKYEIRAEPRIGKGGESFVYLAKRQSDGGQVAVKIYDAFADNPENRNYRRKTIEFLGKNKDYQHTHIMPLWDHGFINLECNNGEIYNRPFDVIPYCKDGALNAADYNMLKNKVVPEILIALNILHTNKLVHRDLKPSNIYMYNNVVLLADFGTTSDIIDTEAHGNTSSRRQTAGYSAPEISENYYIVASDYYSLGCTIATLYNKGKHVYQDWLNEKGKEGEARKAMRIKGLPLECPDNESDLQILVDALIMKDEKIRAGYEAVNLWIKDPKAFVTGWKNKTVQGYEKPPFYFKLEGIDCTTYEELTVAILENWEKGKQYLFQGAIKATFNPIDQTLANRAVDIVEDRENSSNHDLSLAKFLHYLNTTDKPKCPIYWCGEKYEKLSDIATSISKEQANETQIIEMLTSGFLSWKFENTEGTSQETIKSIKEIESITKKHPKLGYFVFMYKNDPEQNDKLGTADEFFASIAKNNKDWYKNAKDVLESDRSIAHLLCIGGTETLLNFKESLTGNFVSNNGSCNLVKFYELLDAICDNKTVIREHYLKFAPQAYLYWFKENLTLYIFNSNKAKEFEKRIKDIQINKEMPINELIKILEKIWTIIRDSDFFSMFQNNYLLTYMGFHTDKEKDGITTNNSYAFFAGDFFGIQVPIGYLKTIGR